MYANRNAFTKYRVIRYVALLLLLLTITPSSRGSSTSIAVAPSFKEVIINTVFEVDLNVSDVTDLYLWVVTVEWNPNIIEFKGYTEGPFLKAGGNTAIMDAGVSPGKINRLVCTVLGPVSGVDGSGSLVTFTFKAVSLGTTPISITFSDLLNSNGEHIAHDTHDGTVLVSPPPPPLTVSISPLSATILVGQPITFTSIVSGGYPPYSYRWYLNGNPVSGATSETWTFTPSTSGIFYVYLKVTDAKGNTAQSEAARLVVSAVPVGGYSIPIQLPTTAKPVTLYIASLTILTALFITIKQKTRRKHRQ
jgi:hypothetical protein